MAKKHKPTIVFVIVKVIVKVKVIVVLKKFFILHHSFFIFSYLCPDKHK